MIRGGVSKWLLRQVLYRHVPRELVERPKMGFGVPLADWLRGPLRAWAEDLLAEPRLRQAACSMPRACAGAGPSISAAGATGALCAVDVLMFEAWRQRWA